MPHAAQHDGLIIGMAGLGVACLIGGAYMALGPKLLLLVRDPAASLEQTALLGAIATLGLIGWAVAAAVALFAAMHALASDRASEAGLFLVASGLLTVVLLLDDMLLLHEKVGPLHLGIAEGVWYAFYATAGALLLLRFRVFLYRTRPVLLLAAGAMLALSVLIDASTAAGDLGVVRTAFEDGAKLLGILLWSTYLIAVASLAVRRLPPTGRA